MSICANPACGREFIPKQRMKGVMSVHCSSKCWHAVRVSRAINTDMSKARLGRTEHARKRLAARFHERFGALSDREVAIVRLALREGFVTGYNRSYNAPTRKEARVATQDAAA